jgi:hypothetical protein
VLYAQQLHQQPQLHLSVLYAQQLQLSVCCMLAGFLLLEAGNDELPEGVVVASLPNRNINAVEVVDMAYFTALKVLDLADNRVRAKPAPVTHKHSNV